MYVNDMARKTYIMNSSDYKSENKINSAKDKYVEKQKTEIDKWNDEIEDLNARITAADANNEATLELKANITALRQKLDEARAKLMEIEEADDDRLEGLKDGLENIWTNIKPELCGNRRDFLVLSLLNQFLARRTGFDPGRRACAPSK